MNILFLTISRINDINLRGIYTDLMRKFRDEGHNVYIVSPRERRYGEKTVLKNINGVHILGVKTLNLQKVGFIEKGIGTILIENQFQSAIKKHFKDINFDLILYSTPPITFTKVIRSLKKKCNAKTYLLLKDIFPQNAVDLQFFSKSSLFYKYFRWKEKCLYQISDHIGCMSPANTNFVIKHNPFISKSKVEVNPNSIELDTNLQKIDRNAVRQKYKLPTNTPIFIYGGNLGKPQGIDFLIEVLRTNKLRKDCFFLIVGNGTEYSKLERFIIEENPKNTMLMQQLDKSEYDTLVRSCDVGLIFLDNRFTIPNYPSRLLSYLEYKMPILCATDINTDIGTIAVNNGYGFKCESENITAFNKCLDSFLHPSCNTQEMGEIGYEFLIKNYTVDNSYKRIMSHFIK